MISLLESLARLLSSYPGDLPLLLIPEYTCIISHFGVVVSTYRKKRVPEDESVNDFFIFPEYASISYVTYV